MPGAVQGTVGQCREPWGSARLLLFPGRIRRRSAGGSGAEEAFSGDTVAAPLLTVAVVTAPRYRSPAGNAARSGAFRGGAGPGRGGAGRSGRGPRSAPAVPPSHGGLRGLHQPLPGPRPDLPVSLGAGVLPGNPGTEPGSLSGPAAVPVPPGPSGSPAPPRAPGSSRPARGWYRASSAVSSDRTRSSGRKLNHKFVFSN